MTGGVPTGALSARYRAYLLGLGVLLLAAVVVRIPEFATAVTTAPAAFWMLAAMAILADTPPFTVEVPYPTPRRQWPNAVSASVCFTFAILLRADAGATLIQVLAVATGALLIRRPPWRALFDLDRYGLAIFLSSLLFLGEDQPVELSDRVETAVLVGGAAATWLVVFLSLTAVEAWLRGGEGWWPALRRDLGEQTLSAAAILVLGVVVVDVAQRSQWLLPAVLVPLYAITRMVRLAYQRIRQAQLDPLTGLGNRTALAAEVGRQVRLVGERAAGEDRRFRFALLLIGLNRFKYINEALGHQAGDEVLLAMASRLVEAAGSDASVTRIGGDQFAVVIDRVTDAGQVQRFAHDLAGAVGGRVDVDTVPLIVDCSIGAAIYPEHGGNFRTLLRHADTAMYDAKDHDRVVALYRPDQDPDAAARFGLLADLRRAVAAPDGTELGLYYQPQIALASGEMVGAEGLLRWRHPRLGAIDPTEVVRVAEQSEVIWQLTRRAIDQTLANLVRWRAAGLDIRASVNVSVRDLYSAGFADWVAGRLREYGIPADRLQLEITETALMAEPNRVLPTLSRLRERGITMSLDDFGTGYSSLLHLRRLPISEIKIDRSFVCSTTVNPDDEAIVRSIIDLANRLGLRVVAEGVEDEQTRDLLLSQGCHVAQGWYYAAAMPAERLASWTPPAR